MSASDSKGTIATLVQTILLAEVSQSLFSWKIDLVQIYPFLRMPLYYEMTRQLKILEPQYSPSFQSRSKSAGSYLKHALRQNEFWGLRPHRIAVMEHPKRVPFQGGKIEPYTHFLLRDWEEDYCVLRWPMQDSYSDDIAHGARSIYYDYFAMKRRVMGTIRSLPEKKMLLIAEVIESAFQTHVDPTLRLKAFILQKMRQVLLGIPIASAFWNQVRPALIVTVVGYAHPDLIWAAKQRHIPVVELQHGVVSPYHLGYHYPHQKKGEVDIFPDYFFSYGNYWAKATEYPISDKKILSVGNPFFEVQKKSGDSLRQDPKTVLFISQKVLGAALSSVALEVAKQLSEFKVLFKLHPKQETTWKEELRDLNATLERGDCSNLKVITDSDASVYDCFREASWQVGVFSTALYEGLGFGLKTLVLDFPGSEYLETLIREKVCLKVKNADEIISALRSGISPNVAPEKMFQNEAVTTMRWKISQILAFKE